MTFSIVARSRNADLFGIAISSSSPAVAARCAHARPGVGAVATQNVTNPALGPAALAELQARGSARDAIDIVMAAERHRDFRQLLAVGRRGPPAIRSGSRVLGIHGEAVGADSAAAGNLLADPNVPSAMVQAFEHTDAPFSERLLAALNAGLQEGGEAGPVHSAGLLVVRNDVAWPIVDLRVDWVDDEPLASLWAAWRVFGPQAEDYVRRGVDPGSAPSYNVPGNP